MLRLRHHARNLRAQRIAVELRGLGDIAHGNGHVIETADHFLTFRRCAWDTRPIIPTRRARGTSASYPSGRRPRTARRGAPLPQPNPDRVFGRAVTARTS